MALKATLFGLYRILLKNLNEADDKASWKEHNSLNLYKLKFNSI